jgi:hypothetical protein
MDAFSLKGHCFLRLLAPGKEDPATTWGTEARKKHEHRIEKCQQTGNLGCNQQNYADDIWVNSLVYQQFN